MYVRNTGGDPIGCAYLFVGGLIFSISFCLGGWQMVFTVLSIIILFAYIGANSKEKLEKRRQDLYHFIQTEKLLISSYKTTNNNEKILESEEKLKAYKNEIARINDKLSKKKSS